MNAYLYYLNGCLSLGRFCLFCGVSNFNNYVKNRVQIRGWRRKRPSSPFTARLLALEWTLKPFWIPCYAYSLLLSFHQKFSRQICHSYSRLILKNNPNFIVVQKDWNHKRIKKLNNCCNRCTIVDIYLWQETIRNTLSQNPREALKVQQWE